MTSSGTARLLRPRPWDMVLAVVVGLVQLVGTVALIRSGVATGTLDPVAAMLLVGSAAALLVRDQAPVPVLALVGVAAILYTWLGYPGGLYTVSVVFAVWAAVAAGHRGPAAIAALAVVASFVVASFLVDTGHAIDADAPFWLAGWFVASFVLGEVSRGRREYLEQVEQRALDAERTREEEARRRAGEERIRIARELHDVLAHHISVINVQSGVAVHLLDRQPEQARTALVAISQASKEALQELRATLGVLRQVDDDDSRRPAPGLATLDELVDRARSTGLEVEVRVTGVERAIPTGIDLAAYRIIQEALTNVARHARAARASISVDHQPHRVVINVEDDGAASPADPVVAGNGLIGMRERATAAGGTLEAGPLPDGGFHVRAVLPTEGRA